MEEPVFAAALLQRPERRLRTSRTSGSDDVEPVAEWEECYQPAPGGDHRGTYEAINKRASAFFAALLQDGLILARGHVADGYLVDIAQSIWYITKTITSTCPTGDLYEAGLVEPQKAPQISGGEDRLFSSRGPCLVQVSGRTMDVIVFVRPD